MKDCVTIVEQSIMKAKFPVSFKKVFEIEKEATKTIKRFAKNFPDTSHYELGFSLGGHRYKLTINRDAVEEKRSNA